MRGSPIGVEADGPRDLRGALILEKDLELTDAREELQRHSNLERRAIQRQQVGSVKLLEREREAAVDIGEHIRRRKPHGQLLLIVDIARRWGALSRDGHRAVDAIGQSTGLLQAACAAEGSLPEPGQVHKMSFEHITFVNGQ